MDLHYSELCSKERMSTNTCGVYKITNATTGEFYIGSSYNIRRRINCHRWHLVNNTHGNPHLQRAWNKYGAQAFEFNIVLLCNIEHQLYFEQTLFDALKPVYNIAVCAEASARGLCRSEETKHRMSKAATGKQASEEAKRKMSAAKKGKSNGRLGKHLSEKTKHKISESLIGEHRSEETKHKMSESHKHHTRK